LPQCLVFFVFLFFFFTFYQFWGVCGGASRPHYRSFCSALRCTHFDTEMVKAVFVLLGLGRTVYSQ
ncbi:MAG: hypothetical protein AAGD25_17390, partial [Cyanobacteria bacterium P01_F01_bin.150]